MFVNKSCFSSKEISLNLEQSQDNLNRFLSVHIGVLCAKVETKEGKIYFLYNDDDNKKNTCQHSRFHQYIDLHFVKEHTDKYVQKDRDGGQFVLYK